MNQPTFISLHVMSRRLGLPESWLRSEAEAGRIPCLRTGRRCARAVPSDGGESGMIARYTHSIPVAEAKAAFGAMVELLNSGRIAEAVPHARRLREMGLPQHPQLGKSRSALEAARRCHPG